MDLPALIPALQQLAHKAGEAIMAIYQSHTADAINYKADNSPVTEADLVANQIIVNGLRTLTPDIPIISEEHPIADFSVRRHWDSFWLIDPLDGTKEFIAKTDEFTVNIALIRGNQSVLGLVYAPATGIGYFATATHAAFRYAKAQAEQPIVVQRNMNSPIRIITSRRHSIKRLDEFMANIGAYQHLMAGSSLKMCLIAEGLADVYPRTGPTSEWDTAAAQCILEAAGGQLLDGEGQALRYNTKPSLINPHFLALGIGDVRWTTYL